MNDRSGTDIDHACLNSTEVRRTDLPQLDRGRHLHDAESSLVLAGSYAADLRKGEGFAYRHIRFTFAHFHTLRVDQRCQNPNRLLAGQQAICGFHHPDFRRCSPSDRLDRTVVPDCAERGTAKRGVGGGADLRLDSVGADLPR
jgi:hypothetical protein